MATLAVGSFELVLTWEGLRQTVGLGNGSVVAVARASPGVRSSANQGTTWSSATGPNNLNAVASAGGGIVIAGADNDLYRSTDSGVNWSSSVFNQVAGIFQDLLDLGGGEMLATASAVATQNTKIYYSSDAGANWSLRATIGDSWIQNFVSSGGGIIVGVGQTYTDGSGYYGRIFRSTDAGQNWSAGGPYGDLTWFQDIALWPTAGKIWASGRNSSFDYSVYQSTDEGATWNVKNTGNYFALGASSDETLLFWGTLADVVYQSTDEGTTTSLVEDFGGSGDYTRFLTEAESDYVFAVVNRGSVDDTLWRAIYSSSAARKSDMKKHPLSGAKAHVYNASGTIRLQWFEPGSLTPDATVDILTAQGTLSPAIEWEADGRLRLCLSDGSTRKESATPWILASWGNWT